MALRDTGCELVETNYCDDESPSGLMRLFEPAFAASRGFTAIEDQVIALARRDTMASLEAPGAIERAVRLLFGIRTAGRALADPRLEALRRAIVVTRYRRHLPDAIARDLRERGYGDAQVRTIEARALAA